MNKIKKIKLKDYLVFFFCFKQGRKEKIFSKEFTVKKSCE
ncbi:hypothetical protein RV17_GL002110 [Enterococcus thailandicus]|nr:hypothetical protein RV17_GL002110 [Enterococcus thailandicus]